MFKINFTLLFILFAMCNTFAQNIKSRLETKKQAIFINSIIDNVSGFKQENDSLKIAILNAPDLYKTFKGFLSQQQLSKKKLKPVNYSNLAVIKNVDVLYVNASSDYRIEQLLGFVHNKPILLITEDYEYRTSIINILSADGAYYVDVNQQKLKNSGFKISENFKKNIISSKKNWNALKIKKLYDFQEKLSLMEEEQKELTQVKETLIEEKQEILNREERILNKLSEQEGLIEKEQELKIELKKKTIQQQKKYFNKLNQFDSLNALYDHQVELAISKQIDLEKQNLLIKEQNLFFRNQKKEIDRQTAILGKQSKQIQQQRQFSILLIGVVILVSIFGFFFYKMRAKEKRLIKELESKNKKIEKTSRQLIRQNKELEQFAFIASHDLQEPLHTVSSFADFMIEDYSDQLDKSGIEYLNFMKQGCKRMSNLITALLDYSKIGVKRDLKTIKSESLIKNIIQDFTSLIIATNTQINYGEMPAIKGYEVELRLLFQNLISNAIKFKKPNVNPQIYIEGKKIENSDSYTDCWQFLVKDNGIGIASEHHHKIFSIFKRLHNLEEYQGTGIGLAHCEKITLLHNGKIWIESTLGNGSSFYFTIKSTKNQVPA